MRIGGRHLGYCTNIHVAETLAEVRAVLVDQVAAVKQRVQPDGPFGVGLRLSAAAADALAAPGALAELRDLLDRHQLYVFTINGFPYGNFHGQRVKEQVYLPDWLDDERLRYSDRLATVLAGLLPDGVAGSVSTVPGAIRSRVSDDDAAAAIADRLRAHARHLEELGERTGKRIQLALEPEPGCQLETVADVIGFFERHLYRGPERARMERHVGLCVDTCHLAVEFEPPAEAISRLQAAGVPIVKLQLSTGLRVPLEGDDASARAALAPFAEDRYLHQVVERRGDQLRRWLDLPEALADAAREAAGDHDATRDADGAPREWRVHFHVPLFQRQLGPFTNTQDDLAQWLALLDQTSCTQLEVETYSWDVLPSAFRGEPLVDAIARELAWVQERL